MKYNTILLIMLMTLLGGIKVSAQISPGFDIPSVVGTGTYNWKGEVGLTNSAVGVAYTLIKDGIPTVSIVIGTGGAVSFGLQPAGTYTVIGSDELPVLGNAIITINAGTEISPGLDILTVVGTGSYYGSGEVGLTNSVLGVTYTLVKDGISTLTTVVGTGKAISFGQQTAGVYSVTGSDDLTVLGSAIITIITPTVFSAYCAVWQDDVSGVLNVYNTIVYGNSAGMAPSNTIGHIYSSAMANNIEDENPSFTSIVNYLISSSSTISFNKGTSSYINQFTNDIQGYARIQGTNVDVGAYEVGLAPIPVQTTRFTVWQDDIDGGTLSVYNNIVYGNNPGLPSGVTFNPVSANTMSSNVLDVDPGFTSNVNYLITTGSTSTYDKGTSTYSNQFIGDVQGYSRIQGNSVDVGAYEAGTAAIPLILTITGVTASNKVYDGTTTATLSDGTLDGIVGMDVVTLVAGTGTFAESLVGSGKTVTAIGYTLGGTNAARYILSGQPSGITADITAVQLTIADPTITLSKVDDGTNIAAVTAGTLSGVLTADVANVTLNATATYDNATLGTGKTITVTYSLSGLAASNYVVPANTVVTTGVIIAVVTTKQLTLKVFLEGLWNGTGMNKCKKWDDGLGDFVDAFATDVVDIISIELRNKTTYATIDYQMHGLELHQDGTVTSAGKTYIEVPAAAADDYHITIRTRNHLETTSANIVSFSGSTVAYDFTDAVTKAYELDPSFTPMAQKDGKWMLYAGNPLLTNEVNTDYIDMSDVYAILNNMSDDTGIYGYSIYDIDGNGVVDFNDIFNLTLPNANIGIIFYFPE